MMHTFGIKLAAAVVVAASMLTAANAATMVYWNLFNVEGETITPPAFVTYATLDDMLHDTNRVSSVIPDGFLGGTFAANIVGSGSDGKTYWNLFNVEGETVTPPAFVTYATLDDMLHDTNRVSSVIPDGFLGGAFAGNIVGTGAFVLNDTSSVPEPAIVALLFLGLVGMAATRRRKQ